MFKEKNTWLKLGCFLIGYNYSLLMSCSEASKKAVRKYASALLVIMILWSLVGFLFSKEYLQIGNIESAVTGFVLLIIIVQIERQIILGNKNKLGTFFRVILGIVMAILGSVVVDQIIFKEDIQKQKKISVSKEVNRILPEKIKEINLLISDTDSLFLAKENERDLLIEEVTKAPYIKLPSSKSERIPGKVIRNGVEKDTVRYKRTYSTVSIPNPKSKLIPDLENQISELREQKVNLFNRIIDIRNKTEKEILQTKGFLDELETMFSILVSSRVSLAMWLLWIFFFLIIELFVLIAKLTDSKNDYEVIVKHQMDIKIDTINKITKFE